MRYLLIVLFSFYQVTAQSQQKATGIIAGNVMDERKKALEGATVELISLSTQNVSKSFLTLRDGRFEFNQLQFDYYRLRISYIGLQTTTIDSIHVREERNDFNLDDITLLPKSSSQNLNEVIIYAEKPLIQSEDGNIIFNAGESALSAGSNAADLLTNVPLVTKDGDGKILVRGKEPKILIDDKPVELNLQQLQDLLESMPGSSIEKIEVMTNPPPQYAMEEGGVINIVTKKGRAGLTARLTVNAGTRGEKGANANFNFRKQGFAVNINAGYATNNLEGNGYSKRQNQYKDSTSYFNTSNQFANQNKRPNIRLNADYDITKKQSLNAVLHLNGNSFNNNSLVTYENRNRFEDLYKLSQRSTGSQGNNSNFSSSLTYTLRTAKPGEMFRLISGFNKSTSENNRQFYHQFFYPDFTPTGADSTQIQLNQNVSKSFHVRASYDLPIVAQKTFLSIGSFQQVQISDIVVDAAYIRKSDGERVALQALINDFRFRQTTSTYRASLKQLLGKQFSITGGISAEGTYFQFDLHKTDSLAKNHYWGFLPFANINKKWESGYNITASYRRTIRRPGIGELNPTRDESDPYNIRFGNPELKPSLSHNFDLVFGKTKTGFYTNLGLGYNKVEDIFSQLRERISDNTTQVTWQNISHRQEYEISSWNGYTINKQLRLNLSASYRYNVYGEAEKGMRKFRNGGSFTSNLNTHYKWSDVYNTTASFTFNRFANPQGTARSNLSMNLGMQARLLDKKLTLIANIIDPFTQQQNRRWTYGNNFTLENYNTTNTRNYRLTVGYNFTHQIGNKKKAADKKNQLQNILKETPKA